MYEQYFTEKGLEQGAGIYPRRVGLALRVRGCRPSADRIEAIDDVHYRCPASKPLDAEQGRCD